MSLLDLVVTLNGRSRDFVDPRLLNLHLRPEWPESGSAELRKKKYNRLWLLARDLDLSSLLERPLFSAVGGGPADGEEGFIAVKVII